MLTEYRQQLLCLSQTSSRSLCRDKWPTGGAFPGESHLELYRVSPLLALLILHTDLFDLNEKKT